MYSIIIPTMWRFAPFPDFLKDLVEHRWVTDVVLIDNDTTRTPPTVPYLSRHKLTYLPQEGNIGVNGAWNLGARHAKTDNLCILNDDVIFDLRVFRKMAPYMNPMLGNSFICTGNVKDFGQIPVTTGEIDIIPWQPKYNRFGYGMMMFVHKDNFIPFPTPDLMRLYYGDNLLFEIPVNNRNRVNHIITNMFHYTPFAATCSTLEDRMTAEGRMESEFKLYEEYKRGRMFIDIEVLDAYLDAAKTPSDINQHLPKLLEYALKCDDVVELGVRTGVSTRAFLRAASFGVRLRSYDLVLEPNIQHVFWRTGRHGYPVSLEQADSRTLEIGETDMLFIDTWHTYDVLKAELAQHGKKVRKYIAFHDTVSAEQELMPAITEFMKENPEWRIDYISRDNNGLLVLAKEVLDS